jgi:hypothetical protein
MTSEEARQTLAARGIPFDEQRVFQYIEAGDENIVRLFLEAGLSPSARDPAGESIIVIAARNGREKLVTLLLESGAGPMDLATEIRRRRLSKKDVWERLASLSAVFTFISSIFIAGIGWYFTRSYNEQQAQANRLQQERDTELRKHQNRLTEMQTIEKMIPHLIQNESGKRAALLAISVLASPEIATRMAEVFRGPGSVDALQTIATGSGETNKPLAVAALTSIAGGGGGDASAALSALGAVFAGKEQSLVTVLRDGEPVCSGFVVTQRDNSASWVVTAGYCLPDATKTALSSLTVETWNKKRWKALTFARSSTEMDAAIGLIKTDMLNVPTLTLADEPPDIGARITSVFYEAPKGDASGKLKMSVAVGTVRRGVVADRLVVRFERRVGAGSGGSPILNTKGEVACMMAVVGNDESEDVSVASSAIKKFLVAQR